MIRIDYIIMFFLFSSISLFGQKYSILEIPPELLKNSNSVVIEETVDVDATNIRKMKIKTRRVVAVLNSAGSKDTRAYEFYNEHSRVKKIEVEVYDAQGERKNRYRKKDFLDISRSGTNMYVDSRVVYLDYTPTFYPYIMVFESEVESGDSGLLNPKWFMYGYAESLQHSELTIRYHSDNKIRYKEKNLEGHDIVISEKPTEFSIKAKNIPAFRYEENSPSKIEIFPHVLLAFQKFQLKNVMATVNNWEDFGLWMENSLFSDVGEISQKTISEVNRLVSDETTNVAKARKIYQYVQEKVRYVSIQIGIGGWKPMPASEVDRLSYGDCKALTNYTKVLLDAVGIPSYYTIVYADETPWHIDEDFASMQGNHAILGIPDGDEISWLECTSQDWPFGYIGTFTDDRNVIMITPEGGKLTRTKIYEPAENSQLTNALIQMNSSGEILSKFESTSKGLQYQNKYSLVKTRESEIDSYYKNRWSHINGFTIVDYEFENNRQEIFFSEKLNLTIPRYVTFVGNDILFNPNVFNQFNYIPPQIKNRKQNLKINRGFIDEDIITIEIPENMQIETLPESTLLEGEFGAYEIKFEKISEHILKYYRKFHMKKGEFPPGEYENYRKFLRTVSRLDNTKILLTKNNTN